MSLMFFAREFFNQFFVFIVGQNHAGGNPYMPANNFPCSKIYIKFARKFVCKINMYGMYCIAVLGVELLKLICFEVLIK